MDDFVDQYLEKENFKNIDIPIMNKSGCLYRYTTVVDTYLF